MNNPFRKFFQEDEESEDNGVSDANDIVSFGNHPYFSKLIAYLERGADEPLDLKDATSMLTSGAEINTFKKIKRHLMTQVKNAESLMERVRHE